GTYLDNTASTAFKAVTLTGVNQFISNNSRGLHILSDGIVTLNNINANLNDDGIYINNTTSTPAKPMAVNIGGTNFINSNKGNGFVIQTHGVVTLNNITANFNGIVNTGGYGLNIDNMTSTTTPANVTLNGVNTFNGNYGIGVSIYSLGAIKANSLTAKDSLNDNGAQLQNNFGSSTAGITLTGTNTFTGNSNTNLSIYSFGIITLNNINASNSDNNLGALIDNSLAATPKAITLTGTNSFSGNWFSGLNLSSKGAITVNNVTASNNGVS
ncbi:MAG: hypothetical protein JNJ43_18415, partial [Anaerolineales bacterium]|nr:hypothetical protein [Anaerolineales bacterium]